MGSVRTYGSEVVEAVRLWRHSGLPAAGAGACDATLLELVERPFDDVADARERLTTLERVLYDRGDGRASFLTVYARVTTEVERGILAGEFDDPEWVGQYLVTFADHYRAAFAAFERGDLADVPDPWQLSFGAALAPETLVLQDVLLGVNAHVNYDLALTLDSVGIDGGRASRRADHDAINDVLERLVDVQQDRLAARYAAGIADLDAAFGRLDEHLSVLALRIGRRTAWYGALALALTDSPPLRAAVRWALDRLSVGVGYVVLVPLAEPEVLDALRTVEDGAIRFDTDRRPWWRDLDRATRRVREGLLGRFGR